MGKYADLLLVSDFDRTLTAPDGTIPKANLEAIRRFITEGGRFTVATGRSTPLFLKEQLLFPHNAPLILFNGAVCYDYAADKTEFADPLPAGTGRFAGELLRRFPDFHYEFQALKRHYVVPRDPARMRFLAEHGAETADVLPAQIREPVYMICIIGRYVPPDDPDGSDSACTEEEDRAFLRLGEWIGGDGNYSPVRSTPQITEVLPRGVSKGSAARRLKDLLGRKTLVCIGDAMNDLSMLQAADLAFVPADGDAELQEGRFAVCASCGEGAVASAIERL